MRKASEYRENARECRKQASKLGSGEARDLLLRMAEQWELLATDRVDLVSRHPELDRDNGREETRAASGRPASTDRKRTP